MPDSPSLSRQFACRYEMAEIQDAVDAMVREDDYSPEGARERIFTLLGGTAVRGSVDSDATTKSAGRCANSPGHGIGTEVQMHGKPTRAKRRSDVLYTVADNDNQSAAYIAYCLNYNAATVRRDLAWLGQNDYVTVTAGEWSVTDKGREYLRTEAEHDVD